MLLARMSMKYLLLVGCLVQALKSECVEPGSTCSKAQSSQESLPSTALPTNTSQEDAGVVFETGVIPSITFLEKSMFTTPTNERATASKNAITENASEILTLSNYAQALLRSNITLIPSKAFKNVDVPSGSSPISSTTSSLANTDLSRNISETLESWSSTDTITSTVFRDLTPDVPSNEVAVNATSVNSTHHLIPPYAESKEFKSEASARSYSSTESIMPSNASLSPGITLPPSLGFSQENIGRRTNGIFITKLALCQNSTLRSNQYDALTVPQNVLTDGNVHANFDEILLNFTSSTAYPDNIVSPAKDTKHILMVDDSLTNSNRATNRTEEERLEDNIVSHVVDTKHILMVDDTIMNSTGTTNSVEEERLEENINSSQTLDEFFAMIEKGNSSDHSINGKQKQSATINFLSGNINNHSIPSIYDDFDSLPEIRNDALDLENVVETMANYEGEKDSTASEDFSESMNLSDDQNYFPNNSFINPNQRYNSRELGDHSRDDSVHTNLTTNDPYLVSNESSSTTNQSLHTPDDLIRISGEGGSDSISDYFQDTHVDLIASDSSGSPVYYPQSARNRRKSDRYNRPQESLYKAIIARTSYAEDLVYHPHQEKLPDVKNPLAGYKLERDTRNEPIVIPPQPLQHTYLPPNQNRHDTRTSNDTSIPSSTSVPQPRYPSEPRYGDHRTTPHRKNSYREDANAYATDSSYAFSYSVNDPYGGNKFSHSERKAGPSTTGEYQVLLPDGRIQTVVYTADHEGYNAKVTYTDADQNVNPVGDRASSAKYSNYESVSHTLPPSDYVTQRPISRSTAGYNTAHLPLTSDRHQQIISQNVNTNLHESEFDTQHDSDYKKSKIRLSSYSDGVNLNTDTFHGDIGERDYGHFNQRNQVGERNYNNFSQGNPIKEGNDNDFNQVNQVREGNDNNFNQGNQVREGNDNNFNQGNQAREENYNHFNQGNQVREGNDNHFNQGNQVRAGNDNHLNQGNQVREGNYKSFNQVNQVREGNNNHVNQRNQQHQNPFNVNMNNLGQRAGPQVHLNRNQHKILSESPKHRLNPYKVSGSRNGHEQSSSISDLTYNDARSKISVDVPHKRPRNYHVSDISKEKIPNHAEEQINRNPPQRKQDENDSSESIFNPQVSTVGPRIFHPSLLALKGTEIWAAYFRDDSQSSTNTPPITRDKLMKTLKTKSTKISHATSKTNDEVSLTHAAYFIPTATSLMDGRNIVKRQPQFLKNAAKKIQMEEHFDRFSEPFEQDEIGSILVDASQNSDDNVREESSAMPDNVQTVKSFSHGRGIFADVKLASDHRDKVQAFDSLLDSNLAIFARTTTNPLSSTYLETPVQSTIFHGKQTLKPKKEENSPGSEKMKLSFPKSNEDSTDGALSRTREQLIGFNQGSDQWLSGPSANDFVELLKLSESTLAPVIIDAIPDNVRNFKRETSQTESFHHRFQNETDASFPYLINSTNVNGTDYRMNTIVEDKMNNVDVLPADSLTIVSRNEGETNISEVHSSENHAETSLTRPNEILPTSDNETVSSRVMIANDNAESNVNETTKILSNENNYNLTSNSEPRTNKTQSAIHDDVHGVQIGNYILEEVEESVPLMDLNTDNNRTMVATDLLEGGLEHNTTLMGNLIKDSIVNATESVDEFEVYDVDTSSNKIVDIYSQSSVGLGDSGMTSEGELSTSDSEFLSQFILFLNKDIKPWDSIPYADDITIDKNNSIKDIGFV